jgi:general stress protein 26
MTFSNEDLTLLTPTSEETHKAEEIEANPNVHVLLGYDDQGLGDAYVEIAGTATFNNSKEAKEKIWSDKLETWFNGKDDPNLVVLEIKPDNIRLMNEHENRPETLEL